MTKKINALDILSGYGMLINSHLSFICPFCNREMWIAYLEGRVLYCKECKKVFNLVMKESKISYEQLKQDGWIKQAGESGK